MLLTNFIKTLQNINLETYNLKRSMMQKKKLTKKHLIRIEFIKLLIFNFLTKFCNTHSLKQPL